MIYCNCIVGLIFNPYLCCPLWSQRDHTVNTVSAYMQVYQTKKKGRCGSVKLRYIALIWAMGNMKIELIVLYFGFGCIEKFLFKKRFWKNDRFYFLRIAWHALHEVFHFVSWFIIEWIVILVYICTITYWYNLCVLLHFWWPLSDTQNLYPHSPCN